MKKQFLTFAGASLLSLIASASNFGTQDTIRFEAKTVSSDLGSQISCNFQVIRSFVQSSKGLETAQTWQMTIQSGVPLSISFHDIADAADPSELKPFVNLAEGLHLGQGKQSLLYSNGTLHMHSEYKGIVKDATIEVNSGLDTVQSAKLIVKRAGGETIAEVSCSDFVKTSEH
jgi:hypothetical protein